jgi:hypothetical protein
MTAARVISADKFACARFQVPRSLSPRRAAGDSLRHVNHDDDDDEESDAKSIDSR